MLQLDIEPEGMVETEAGPLLLVDIAALVNGAERQAA